MASIQNKADQLRFSGKGPLDAKSLVKTYSELTDPKTWTVDGTLVAYNGMITAVWLDKTVDENGKYFRNGIYYFFDPKVTSVLTQKNADVSNSANWHKLGSIDDLPGLSEQLAELQKELDNVKEDIEELQESATVIIEPGQSLPEQGVSGKLYVVLEEATTYVWYNNAYMPVGDGAAEEIEIQVIHGGSAV